MYPNYPPATATSNNSFQFQPENGNNVSAGGGVTSWSTVMHGPPATNGLLRQSSSPAAFFHDQHLMSDLGISHTKEGGHESYNNHPQHVASKRKDKQSRFSSDQLCFTNYDSTNDARQLSSAPRLKKASTSSTSSTSQRFTIGPWEECNSFRSHESYDSQSQDMVSWKIRAKRGFATCPRSIAERQRRNKINLKLKTLQELLPNMDKQASYADMLDLAVEHVRVLQYQIQELSEKLNNCKCGCIKRN